MSSVVQQRKPGRQAGVKTGHYKTHCKRGHEYTPENSLWNGGRNRSCRTCHNWRKRAKAAAIRKYVRLTKEEYAELLTAAERK